MPRYKKSTANKYILTEETFFRPKFSKFPKLLTISLKKRYLLPHQESEKLPRRVLPRQRAPRRPRQHNAGIFTLNLLLTALRFLRRIPKALNIAEYSSLRHRNCRCHYPFQKNNHLDLLSND